MANNFFDSLSGDEATVCKAILCQLADCPWAQPLLKAVRNSGGLTQKNKAHLFELRFAHALHAAEIVPEYEIPGEGGSTLDFGFCFQGQRWRVELMRHEETDAAKDATTEITNEDGVTLVRRAFHTNAADPRHRDEGEILKAIQRICQKFERNGKPNKFPAPDGAFNVLLVDVRTFLFGGDRVDRIHVAFGAECVKTPSLRYSWKGEPISGVFNKRTTVRGASELQERLHFLGFVCENEFGPGAFGRAIEFCGNPKFFSTANEGKAARSGWPFLTAH